MVLAESPATKKGPLCVLREGYHPITPWLDMSCSLGGDLKPWAPKLGFVKGLHGFPHELAVLPSQLSTVDCLQVSPLRGFLMSGFQMLS